MARGVYFRTEKDGTPLATPELRISATNNRTVYYEDQTAKDAAMQAGEIKEGSIVLTGYADSEAEILMKEVLDWDNAVTSITISSFPYTAPADGVLFMQPQVTDTGSANRRTVYVNNVAINEVVPSVPVSGTDYRRPSDLYIQLKKGDVVSFSSTQYLELRAATVFVPFKTVAEPVTMPVNVTTHIIPNWNSSTSIPYATMNAGYTVPSDGQLIFRYGSSSGVTITINGHTIFTHNTTTYSYIGSVTTIVGKSDLVTFSGPSATYECIFVPFKS